MMVHLLFFSLATASEDNRYHCDDAANSKHHIPYRWCYDSDASSSSTLTTQYHCTAPLLMALGFTFFCEKPLAGVSLRIKVFLRIFRFSLSRFSPIPELIVDIIVIFQVAGYVKLCSCSVLFSATVSEDSRYAPHSLSLMLRLGCTVINNTDNTLPLHSVITDGVV